MAATKKKARKPKTAKHPGVVWIKPDDSHPHWRARYKDPDTGKFKKVPCPPVYTDAPARARWAKGISKKIERRKAELEDGAPRATGLLLTDAVNQFFDEPDANLAPKTIAGYRSGAAKFLEWAEDNDIKTASQITGDKLRAFRDSLVRTKKQRAAPQGKRGQHKSTGKRLSAYAVNRDLRSVGRVLRWMVKHKKLPFCNRTDVAEALEPPSIKRGRPVWLTRAEIKQLLKATAAYDALTFEMTREEKLGKRPIGTTRKYTPITPLTHALLLTGMRLSEATGLTWDYVDLAEKKLRLDGEFVKTRYYRDVDLSICPSLVASLKAVPKNKREGSVWGVGYEEAEKAMKRLKKRGAPERFNWKVLRSTCETYWVNAGGIDGTASVYRAARSLGHSVVVAEKHYLGKVTVPKTATTLEQAMSIASVKAVQE